MRLLASTDLALRVLMLLGRSPPDRPVSVERMAHMLGGLSRNHLHKIVQDLSHLGATRTIRGAGGGVMLAQAPARIKLGALVRELEKDQALVECLGSVECICTMLPGCRLRGMLTDARNHFYERLDAHTLADCL